MHYSAAKIQNKTDTCMDSDHFCVALNLEYIENSCIFAVETINVAKELRTG
jgi:hypothetical protein